jgi:hypothetical protein
MEAHRNAQRILTAKLAHVAWREICNQNKNTHLDRNWTTIVILATEDRERDISCNGTEIKPVSIWVKEVGIAQSV